MLQARDLLDLERLELAEAQQQTQGSSPDALEQKQPLERQQAP